MVEKISGEKSRLFVAYKPPYISSNRFLGTLKRKYQVKKAGFSGILDPFAEGVLVVAFGRYTRLFQFLAKTPKVYTATILLGGVSPTLDVEQVVEIKPTPPFSLSQIERVLEGFKGEYFQRPPIYSAKKVGGIPSYRLAIGGKKVSLSPVKVKIFNLKLLHYTHPFLTIRAEVGEGCYIRSLGRDIAEKLGTTAFLTSLKREREGKFYFECEKSLNPLDYLSLPKNRFLGEWQQVELGKPISPSQLVNPTPGRYYITNGELFSIVEIKGTKGGNRATEGGIGLKVSYLLNRIPLK